MRLECPAELYIAHKFSNVGWDIYFPHKDKGFDFIASRRCKSGKDLVRPVQVKCKYPTTEHTPKHTYGFEGYLSRLHPEMVVVIMFFTYGCYETPEIVAYMPVTQLTKSPSGYRCIPAHRIGGEPKPRPEYAHFFGDEGLAWVANEDWVKQGRRLAVASGPRHRHGVAV
jgi:hypothetical protein